jgi:hypothetical protein
MSTRMHARTHTHTRTRTHAEGRPPFTLWARSAARTHAPRSNGSADPPERTAAALGVRGPGSSRAGQALRRVLGCTADGKRPKWDRPSGIGLSGIGLSGIG